MASEIRVNKINSRSGLGTISLTNTGIVVSGIITATSIDTSSTSAFSSGLNVTGGSVGIGTDNPSAPLHILSSEDRGILIESTDANAYIVFKDTDTSSDFANRVGTISDGLYFNTGGGGERLRITSSGRLSIGNYSSPKAPLHIRGEYLDQAPVAGVGTGSFVISNSDTNYGINFGVRSSGNGWIQQTRVDGIATNYSLLLNPLGGNIGIGTDNPSYLLDVKTTDDTTYTAGNFVNNPVARLHNQSFTTDSFASLVFRTGSGDNAIGFVYPGTVNQADFVICNDGGTNGVERFRITSSGVVGIGTDNPESGSKLTVNGGIFVKSFLNSATIHGGGLDYINDGRGTRITSFGASGAKTAISFAQGNGGSGASEIARFDTNGNLVFASSGQGIDFSATSDGSGTTTSELLDDYEEGTFDPTVSMTASGSLTLQSSYNTLSYTKIGRLVTISGQIRIDAVSSPSGNIVITNLPFTVRTTIELARAGGGLFYFDDSAGSGNYYKPVPWGVEESLTKLYIYTQHSGGGITPGAADEIGFSCTYVAA